MLPVLFLGQGIFGREPILGFPVHRDEEEKRHVHRVLDLGAGAGVVAGVAVVAAVPDNAAVVAVLDNAALALLHVVCAVFLFLGIGGFRIRQ